MAGLVDQFGNPLLQERVENPRGELARMRQELSLWKARAKNGIHGRYDAAQTDMYTQRHWANADFLSPDAANSHAVRRRLRSESRYEVVENNSFLKGMALSMANDFTGSGPRLRIQDGRYTDTQSQLIRTRFEQWAKSIRLREKIWRMRMARFVDGESFAMEFNNRRLRHPVQVDWWLFEADQCGFGLHGVHSQRQRANFVDGIQYDRHQQPIRYFILPYHPGANYLEYNLNVHRAKGWEGKWINSEFILHWFRRDRPWLRGIPETTPVLKLCALLRRYTEATVHAAETAADYAAVLKAMAPPFTGNWTAPITGSQENYQDFDVFPIDKNMFTILPYGYDLSQLKAEQPTSKYNDFVEALVKEIARALLIPFNVAMGFSGGYNFASGTLDRQLYQGSINRDRDHFEDHVLDRMFLTWWLEATRIPDYLGQGFDREAVPVHGWSWDVIQEHADPVKVAQAQKILWDTGAITDEDIQERYNRDTETHYKALERQNERRKELGMPTPGLVLQQAVLPADDEEPKEDVEGDVDVKDDED